MNGLPDLPKMAQISLANTLIRVLMISQNIG